MEYITVNFIFTPQCYESVVNALCALYYLPCGYNGTIQVPRFFCSDACTNVSTQMCSDNWDALRSFVIAAYSGGQDQVWDETIIMPNCSNTDLFIEAFDLDDDCCEPSYLVRSIHSILHLVLLRIHSHGIIKCIVEVSCVVGAKLKRLSFIIVVSNFGTFAILAKMLRSNAISLEYSIS